MLQAKPRRGLDVIPRVRLILAIKNVTLMDLAREIDLPYASLHHSLSGKMVPSEELKVKIAKALDVSPSYLWNAESFEIPSFSPVAAMDFRA